MAVANTIAARPPVAARPQQRRPAAKPRRPCCHRLAVRAGLLDLLRGGSDQAKQLPTDPEGEALKAWLMSRGLPTQKLAAAAVPGAGRGLTAAQPIGKGEALLQLPLQLAVTPEVAAQQSALAPLLADMPLPAWSVLALWLAEARAAGDGGAWWPYVRLLPQQTGCVLEWTEEEAGWLRGSHLHSAAQEMRGAAEASWAEMQPLVAEAQRRGLGPAGAFSRGALQWAFSILLSRLVRLPSLDSTASGSGQGGAGVLARLQQQRQQEPPGTECLLPFADLLNHSSDCSAFLDWSAGDAAVVLRADRRYRAGEEVHVSYGQKSGGELLLSYGFCPEPSSNPHDGCKLRLALAADDPAHAWKAAALQEHGFAASQLFPLRMAAAPYELVHYAALAAAQVGSQEEAAQLARRLFVSGDFPPSLQQQALEMVVQACQAAAKAYPSSLDADKAELDRLRQREAATASSSSSPHEHDAAGGGAQQQAAGGQQERWRRRRQVLQVLVYERQVLARTVFVLQQELKDLKRMARD